MNGQEHFIYSLNLNLCQKLSYLYILTEHVNGRWPPCYYIYFRFQISVLSELSADTPTYLSHAALIKKNVAAKWLQQYITY